MVDKNKAQPRKGDLVRWVKEHRLYIADQHGNSYPHNPVYEFGIVMEVSHVDINAVIIFGFTPQQLIIGDIVKDEIEIISRAPLKLYIATPDEVKKYEK